MPKIVIDVEGLYFEWLLTSLHPDGVVEGVANAAHLLHNCEFHRRVGNDINRAADGANLRKEFLVEYEEIDVGPNVTNDFLMQECSWFEMLVALSRHLDYLYEGGVEGRFIELITNLHLDSLLAFSNGDGRNIDQLLVDRATSKVDDSQFDRDGHGGLFPLTKAGHPDQRRVEIWDQHAAYFRERLEGVLWTSTN